MESWKEIYDQYTDMKLEELIRKFGFDGLETRFVTTKDGYILKILRIKRKGANEMMPILFVHGLSACADTFFVNKNNSAPVVFANNDYDIWFLNSRGTEHSLTHSIWNSTTEKEFWLFSWQEIGLIDLPLAIDMVLENNVHEKLILVGHSEGSTIIFVTLSDLPQYNTKVSLAVHWGVSVFHENCSTNPFIRGLCKSYTLITQLVDTLGLVSLLRIADFRVLLSLFCKYDIFKTTCNEAIKMLFQEAEQIEHIKDWSYAIDKTLCGGSAREFFHFMQVGNSGRFARYDHGPKINMRMYNSTEPPLFHLENVNSTQLLWCGDRDIFCSENDIRKLVERLGTKHIEPASFKGKPIWTHYDFLIAKDVTELLYDDLLKIMKKYSS
ncbi:hypothetical protein HHI36_012547 [Cryptolaemus montrouzieri]|uniref:Lipase n=1 Tax=Cryptolaemus montrouzieri TaxID=559131 RepID=A0ABD2NG06_9CUCU